MSKYEPKKRFDWTPLQRMREGEAVAVTDRSIPYRNVQMAAQYHGRRAGKQLGVRTTADGTLMVVCLSDAPATPMVPAVAPTTLLQASTRPGDMPDPATLYGHLMAAAVGETVELYQTSIMDVRRNWGRMFVDPVTGRCDHVPAFKLVTHKGADGKTAVGYSAVRVA